MKRVFKITIALFLLINCFSCSTKHRFFDVSEISKLKSLSDYNGKWNINQIDVVTFGRYPQSDIDGKTDDLIEWIVLDKRDDKALLLSKKIIDFKCYREIDWDKNNLWEMSDIREWLNKDFFYKAFRANEQLMIANALLVNNNERSGKLDEISTDDKVFLLSVDEIKQYFGPFQIGTINGIESFWSYQLKAEYTNYVGPEYESLTTCNWWLRSSSADYHSAVRVTVDGFLDEGGEYVNNDYGVRPALWVKY